MDKNMQNDMQTGLHSLFYRNEAIQLLRPFYVESYSLKSLQPQSQNM